MAKNRNNKNKNKKKNKKIMGRNGESSSSESEKEKIMERNKEASSSEIEKETIMGRNGESSLSDKKKEKVMGIKGESESESEKEKEKIMVHTVNVEGVGFLYGEFFTINLSNGEIKELPYVLIGGDNGLNSMVSFGSIVYVVGGQNREKAAIKPPNSRTDNKEGFLDHYGMSFIDLNSNSGWNTAPNLNLGTPYYVYDPAVASLGGKIYSFWHPDYAGIFDPVEQKWEKLLPPTEVKSFVIDSRTEVIADPDNNRLLVFFYDPIRDYFAYYPDEKCWKIDVTLSSLPWSSGPMLLLKGGLFLIYVRKVKDVDLFKVFNSVDGQWLKVRFTSEVPVYFKSYRFEDMLYLGNDVICLLFHSRSNDLTLIHVCKFKFVRYPDELLFTWFPKETYPLNSKCVDIPSYLPL